MQKRSKNNLKVSLLGPKNIITIERFFLSRGDIQIYICKKDKQKINLLEYMNLKDF